MKIFIGIFGVVFFIWVLFLNINVLPLTSSFATSSSAKIYDRHGELLRETLSDKGGRRRSIHLGDVSKDFIKLLIATEDKRFFMHPGVDPLALVRSAYQWFKTGTVVSGGSTLTMQLARMTSPGPRHIQNKIREMFVALYLEMALSKGEILEMYLNNLPFGNELYGLSEASAVYFKKDVKDLSLSESAYLLGIIRAPSVYNPYRKPNEILKLRERILKNYLGRKNANKERVQEALVEKVVIYPLQRRFKAPHFTDFVLKNSLDDTIRTSLDLELNEEIDAIVKRQLDLLSDKNVNQISVLVIHNKTAEIIAYVGSADYWGDRFQGMIDGVRQVRQPGSSLKPFTYARALDLGMAPNIILADVKTVYSSEIGDYIPENYDRKFRGPVLMRTALANSLNVPAIQLVGEMGVTELYKTLKDLHFEGLTEQPAYYGLGLTLGNVEVSLFELVRAYSVFARGGMFCELTFLKADKAEECHKEQGQRLITPKTITMIRDFLSDRHSRTISFGSNGPLDFDYPVMIKTGTSQNFRDNWTVAVTPDYTVGVWAGNFNGDPMQNVSGVSGAAPIAHHVVDYLYERSPWYSWQDGVKLKKQRVCSLSGKRSTRHCQHTKWEYLKEGQDITDCDFHVSRLVDRRNDLLATNSCFRRDVVDKTFVSLPGRFLEWQQENWGESLVPHVYSSFCPDIGGKGHAQAQAHGFQILSPEDGATYLIDLHRPRLSQYLSLRTTHPYVGFAIYLDEKELTEEEGEKIVLRPGEHRLKLVSLDGEKVLDEVKFRVK